jgi:hypothetical protein
MLDGGEGRIRARSRGVAFCNRALRSLLIAVRNLRFTTDSA